MTHWWRRVVQPGLERVRRNGRARLLWSLRVTVAATASYVVATALFPGTQPLLAPLTAMLVVQVTPLSLLASGLDRVIAVVSGVALATGFATVVPLRWWSLGLLLLIALTIGQYLRLRSNLIEVAISAMLVLGVGSIGAEAAAWQRITETFVGAGVGILANLVFPPKVGSADAGQAIDGLADRVSGLLTAVADTLAELTPQPAQWLGTSARGWLGDARRITHEIPDVGALLLRAEESRRLNVRAVGTPHVEPGMRQGLEALEHSAMSIRGLMRALADSAGEPWVGDEDLAAQVLPSMADDLRTMAAAIDAFGELVRNEAIPQARVTPYDVTRLNESLAALQDTRARLDQAMASAPSPDLLELHTAARSTADRLLHELAIDERVRRQLRLTPARRRPLRRPPPAPPAPPEVGPDAETQVLPKVRDRPHPD